LAHTALMNVIAARATSTLPTTPRDMHTMALTFTMLIESYMRLKDTSRAESLFIEMLSAKIKLDEYVYGSLVHGYISVGDMVMAETVIDKMIDNGITLNEVLCNMIIKAHFENKNVEAAERVYELVKGKQLLNEYIVTTMLDGYAQLRAPFAKVEKLFADSREYKVDYNEVVFTAFLKYFISVGNIKQAHEQFLHMMEYGQINHVTFNIMLQAFLQNGFFDTALELYEKVSQVLSPNIYIVNQMISYYLYINAVPSAEQFLQNAMMKHPGIVPDLTTYNLLLSAYARHSSKKKAEEIYKNILPALRLTPDEGTYHAMLSLYSNIGYMQDAEHYFNLLTRKEAIAYNSLMKTYVLRNKRIEKAEKLYREMKANNVEPTQHTFYTLLRGYIRTGNLSKAKEFVKKEVQPFLKLKNLRISPQLNEVVQEVNNTSG